MHTAEREKDVERKREKKREREKEGRKRESNFLIFYNIMIGERNN